MVDSAGTVDVLGDTYSYNSGGQGQTLNAGLLRDTDMALDSNDNLSITTRGENTSEYTGPGHTQIVKRVDAANSFSARTHIDHVVSGRNNHVYGDIAISPADDPIYVTYRHEPPMEHSIRVSTGATLPDGSIVIERTWTVSDGVSGDVMEGSAALISLVK